MADDCKERYEECVAARQSRVTEVLASAAPWETIDELAARAGVAPRTVDRAKAKLLQTASDGVDCNSEPPPTSVENPETVVWFLKKQLPSVRAATDGVFAWYCQLSPATRRAFLKRLQEFD